MIHGPFKNKWRAKAFAKQRRAMGYTAQYYQKGPTKRWYVTVYHQEPQLPKDDEQEYEDTEQTLSGQTILDDFW